MAIRFISAMLGGCVSLAGLQLPEWHLGPVDGNVGGRSSSMRADKYGSLHVASCYELGPLMEYSFWDPDLNKWFTSSIGKCSGFSSLALDSKNRPHISAPAGNGRLLYTYWDGSAWRNESIETHAVTINYYTSIALDAEDEPSISYYEETGAGDNHLRLRVATRKHNLWELRTVDRDLGSGKFNSMAIDAKGRLQIAYGNVEYQNTSLRYAAWNGASWNVEILDGVGGSGSSMWSVDLALDRNDVPHIAYTDVKNRLIKYATKEAGKWVLQPVDTIEAVGYPDRNGIAVDCHNHPYLSYYDSGSGMLKVAHREAGKWMTEIVDRNFNGFTSALQISRGTLWVTYSSASGAQLQYARRRLSSSVSGAACEEGEAKQ